jgi:hypothetical protein
LRSSVPPDLEARGLNREVLDQIRSVAVSLPFRRQRSLWITSRILVTVIATVGIVIAAFQFGLPWWMQEGNHNHLYESDVGSLRYQVHLPPQNDQLLVGVCSAGNIRRRECVWAIEQAIAMTFQLQGEYQVVSDRLGSLDATIRQDCLTALESCNSEAELDFLFPEITRIQGHDLAAIDSWRAHSDWYQTLPAQELKIA